jgi:transcriptional regulator GlxA family with amidase domain
MGSVAGMARELCLSEDHFIRLFRQRFGQTPGRYLIQARVDRARHLLRFSSHSIKQIAAILGYREPYFFSRQFRQRTGLTPSVYRNR